jgi:hypothetical protein
VLWSGDPLDVFSRAQRALIGGREIYSWNNGEAVHAEP